MAILTSALIFKAAATLIGSTALNDLGQETLIKILSKFEKDDPTNICKTILHYIASDQDIHVGITFTDSNDIEDIKQTLTSSHPEIMILDGDQIQRVQPNITDNPYHLILSGRTKPIFHAIDQVCGSISNQKMLNTDKPANTMFGRLTQDASSLVKRVFK